MSESLEVSVEIALWEDGDWDRVNRALEAFDDLRVSAGTNMVEQVRDMQFEVGDEVEAVRVRRGVEAALIDAGLWDQMRVLEIKRGWWEQA